MNFKNNYIAIVPFRSGSKGLKNKNFLTINREPLWRRAVMQGYRVCENILYSTDYYMDDHEKVNLPGIYDHRPKHLASDHSTMTDLVLYLIKKYSLEQKNLVLLQPTSPMRSDANILSAIKLFDSGGFKMVFSTVEKDRKALKYGFVSADNEFRSINNPDYCFANRQSLPKLFGPNGAVYVFSANEFLSSTGFPTSGIGASEMTKLESMDIDTKADYLEVLKCLEISD